MSDLEKLRPLMQTLGDAINSSLSDSPTISDAIEKLKAAGYDVFLILEATIAFNKRDKEPDDADASENAPTPLVDSEGNIDESIFKGTGDMNFLSGLKIKLNPE